MPAFKTRAEHWREWLRGKLTEAGVFEEFKRIQRDAAKVINQTHGHTGSTLLLHSWRQAAQLFTEHFDSEEFEVERRRALIHNQVRRHNKHARKISKMASPKKRSPRLTQTEECDTVVSGVNSVVYIKGADTDDILADTKWVYQNIARLIISGRDGVRTLDPKVLKDAPSNGAVGLARYALEDPTKFYEKFVTKILPKDDNTPKAPTEDELKSELDPTFDDLAKYMRKINAPS